jgi:hypothetical protein
VAAVDAPAPIADPLAEPEAASGADALVRRLEVPAEPVELRDGLRQALLDGGDWREGFRDDICIGVWLWSRWQPVLEPAGVPREHFIDIVVSTHRELWLWLLGDRRWEQYLSGLAGRVARRALAGA